ncbi:PspC domain-containing protein [Candidatus Daviesbacteria bacterium]|nr:PspC domain-containing protein [Candidatus Daviesbacteria bacterium]
MKNKKFYRSKSNRVIAGVIGGLGEYFNVDANILRLFWILLVMFTGIVPGIIAYIVAAVTIPEEPKKM